MGKFGSPQFSYKDGKKNCRIEMYGGRICENVCQAIARDILGEALLEIDRLGFEILGHVHDEVIVAVDEDNALNVLESILSREMKWAQGLPLAAEGFLTTYYRKG